MPRALARLVLTVLACTLFTSLHAQEVPRTAEKRVRTPEAAAPVWAAKLKTSLPDIGANNYDICPDPEPCNGGGGGSGCADCWRELGGPGNCDRPGNHWADCTGGWQCWFMWGVGWHCEAYCGDHRCYSA